MRVRAIVIEDEPIARAHLRAMLESYEWLDIVGEAGDGQSALTLVDALRPDLVFLDIEMPALSGLEVLRKLTYAPDVIITTAKDRYAVAAFELEAVDYLLKPFGADRLRRALERVRRDDRYQSSGSALRAREVIERNSADSPLARVFVRDRGKVVQLALSDIERLEAQDDYVAVYSKGRRHLVYVSLGDFTSRLSATQFVRIHRSHVVNLDYVASISTHDPARVEVLMRDGTRLLASRARTKELRQLTRHL